MDARNPSTLYAGSTTVYTTTDAGANWSKASKDLTAGTTFGEADFIHTMAQAAGSPSTAVFTGSKFGKVFMNASASDSTSKWTDITGNLPAYDASAASGNPWTTGLAASPNSSREAWATIGKGSGQRVWHTTNAGNGAGTTWSDITGSAATAVPNIVVDTILV